MELAQTGLEILTGYIAGAFVLTIALQNREAQLNWQKWLLLPYIPFRRQRRKRHLRAGAVDHFSL